jgi:predicted MFS family arabinose efflux permease
LCAALPLPALAKNAWMLGAFLVVYGAAAGAMDVAMNTQAVDVERGYGRPVMVSFHALFSLGGMLGSLMGSAAAARNLAPAIHLTLAGGLMAAIAVFASRGLLPQADGPAGAARPLGGWWRPLLGLSAIAFCVLVGEGAMADWSAVYLNQLTTAAFAPVGYAVFSLTMAGGRLAGDWLHGRLGAEATVRAGSALAAVGLAGALALGSVPAALIGFACVGLGYSSIFPIVCSVAGKRAGSNPQAGIAAVAGTGYLGFLVGPPFIGFLAQATSLRAALGAVAALSALTAALASVAPNRVKAGR